MVNVWEVQFYNKSHSTIFRRWNGTVPFSYPRLLHEFLHIASLFWYDWFQIKIYCKSALLSLSIYLSLQREVEALFQCFYSKHVLYHPQRDRPWYLGPCFNLGDVLIRKCGHKTCSLVVWSFYSRIIIL